MTYGEKKPANIFSYLAPTIKSLVTLQEEGMIIKTSDLKIFTIKTFVIAVIGDFPAISELLLHKTQASECGCRVCTVRGEKTDGRKSGYSFIGDSESTRGEIRSKAAFEVNKVIAVFHFS